LPFPHHTRSATGAKKKPRWVRAGPRQSGKIVLRNTRQGVDDPNPKILKRVHDLDFVIRENIDQLPFSWSARKDIHPLHSQVFKAINDLYFEVREEPYNLDFPINASDVDVASHCNLAIKGLTLAFGVAHNRGSALRFGNQSQSPAKASMPGWNWLLRHRHPCRCRHCCRLRSF
jgi:hypothetical protein